MPTVAALGDGAPCPRPCHAMTPARGRVDIHRTSPLMPSVTMTGRHVLAHAIGMGGRSAYSRGSGRSSRSTYPRWTVGVVRCTRDTDRFPMAASPATWRADAWTLTGRVDTEPPAACANRVARHMQSMHMSRVTVPDGACGFRVSRGARTVTVHAPTDGTSRPHPHVVINHHQPRDPVNRSGHRLRSPRPAVAVRVLNITGCLQLFGFLRRSFFWRRIPVGRRGENRRETTL